MRSLKTKNALLTTALVLLTLGSVGWLQHRQLGQDYIALLLQQQDALAQTVVDDLGDRLATHQAVLARMVRDVEASTLGDPVAQQRLFARSGARTIFDEIVLIAPDGRIIAGDPPQQGAAPVSVDYRDFFRQVLASGEPVTRP